ncbi:MAG: hypothetical protein Q4D38_14820 [Planctomycetia bacterium]|nr:hypothetical protein [Planctomycetia bacterium]
MLRKIAGVSGLLILVVLQGVFVSAQGVSAPQNNAPTESCLPELVGKKILFIVRPQYKGDHHNTATMFQKGEINAAKFSGPSKMQLIDFANNGTVETLIDCPEGIVRDPEISYDGKRVVFSMRKNKEDDYHIYEMNLDDKSIRQITFGEGLSDIDPVYLPDGRIAFSSTREPKYCMCNRHIMCNLYVMNPDGSDMLQIAHSTLFEGHASVLSDGRIIYDRWEYVDRFFGDAQGLWTTNPDGTSNVLFYGNNTGSPGSFLDPREVPGSKWVVSTMSGSHYWPWGAIAMIDRSRGIEGKDGVVHTWPPEAIHKISIVGNRDSMVHMPIKYEDPFPLSETTLLASRQLDSKSDKMGIYLLGVDRPDTLVYAEPADSSLGCYDSMIIEPRPLPPVVEDRVDLSKTTGTLYVSDVYIGTGMDAIPRGEVKWLRVVESPEKRFWTSSSWSGGTGEQAPGMAFNDYNNKRILGTVPVESDGSAYFELPSDTFVYFQLLDDQGRMIQSMRSGTIVRPGENQGCIGCHEDRLNAVGPRTKPLATNRPPDKLHGWYGPARNFSYMIETQPVLTKYCVQCHDKGKPGAEKLCLAPDRNIVFNNAYYELRKNKKYVNVVGAGPAPIQNPRSWGSFVSPLARVVLEGHGDPERDKFLTLSQEEKDRVITWIDLNAPFYAEYSTPYTQNFTGRCPLTEKQLQRLGELVGYKVRDWKRVNDIWFDRPELSPCLEKMDKESADYAEALSIIQAGKETLISTPPADMPGCVLVPREQAMQDKYDQRLREERDRVEKCRLNMEKKRAR